MTPARPKASFVPRAWELPAPIRERIGDAVGRQRAMSAEGHLLLILHRPPTPDEAERHGRLFWRRPDGSWKSNELGDSAAALSRHLAEFSELIERYDREETAARLVSEYRLVLEGMSPLRHTARNLHAALQEARNMVPQDHDLINARDRAYEIERNAELLYEEIQNSLDLVIARQSESQAAVAQQMAVAAHRLNMLVAFFFPVATLATVFGMGLDHRLERYLPPPAAFFAVVAVGLLLGFVLAAALTRPRTPA